MLPFKRRLALIEGLMSFDLKLRQMRDDFLQEKIERDNKSTFMYSKKSTRHFTYLSFCPGNFNLKTRKVSLG